MATAASFGIIGEERSRTTVSPSSEQELQMLWPSSSSQLHPDPGFQDWSDGSSMSFFPPPSGFVSSATSSRLSWLSLNGPPPAPTTTLQPRTPYAGSLMDSASETSERLINPRYKTEICRNFKERARCIYGDRCQFAHGRKELREVVRNAKYKTKLCQKYWIQGYCAYGPRCNFLHDEASEDDKRAFNLAMKQRLT